MDRPGHVAEAVRQRESTLTVLARAIPVAQRKVIRAHAGVRENHVVHVAHRGLRAVVVAFAADGAIGAGEGPRLFEQRPRAHGIVPCQHDQAGPHQHARQQRLRHDRARERNRALGQRQRLVPLSHARGVLDRDLGRHRLQHRRRKRVGEPFGLAQVAPDALAIAGEAFQHCHRPVRGPRHLAIGALRRQQQGPGAVLARRRSGTGPRIELQRHLMHTREQRGVGKRLGEGEGGVNGARRIIVTTKGLLHLRAREPEADHQFGARQRAGRVLGLLQQVEPAPRIARPCRRLCKVVQQARTRQLVVAGIGQRQRALPPEHRRARFADAQARRRYVFQQRGRGIGILDPFRDHQRLAQPARRFLISAPRQRIAARRREVAQRALFTAHGLSAYEVTRQLDGVTHRLRTMNRLERVRDRGVQRTFARGGQLAAQHRLDDRVSELVERLVAVADLDQDAAAAERVDGVGQARRVEVRYSLEQRERCARVHHRRDFGDASRPRVECLESRPHRVAHRDRQRGGAGVLHDPTRARAVNATGRGERLQ